MTLPPFPAAAVIAVLLAAAPLHAQPPARTVALVTSGGRCVAPVAEHAGAELRTRDCKGAPPLTLDDGILRSSAGWCVDWVNEGGPAHLATCRVGRASQQWSAGAAGVVRNVGDGALCLDVEGGRTADRTRVLVWRCHDLNAPPHSQQFRVVAHVPGA
jgi:hypothetical protein